MINATQSAAIDRERAALEAALRRLAAAYREMAAFGVPDEGAEAAYDRALRAAERAAERLDCLTRAVGLGEPGRAELEALLASLEEEARGPRRDPAQEAAEAARRARAMEEAEAARLAQEEAARLEAWTRSRADVVARFGDLRDERGAPVAVGVVERRVVERVRASSWIDDTTQYTYTYGFVREDGSEAPVAVRVSDSAEVYAISGHRTIERVDTLRPWHLEGRSTWLPAEPTRVRSSSWTDDDEARLWDEAEQAAEDERLLDEAETLGVDPGLIDAATASRYAMDSYLSRTLARVYGSCRVRDAIKAAIAQKRAEIEAERRRAQEAAEAEQRRIESSPFAALLKLKQGKSNP